MPVVRYWKTQALMEQLEQIGPCVKPGMEIWEVSRVNVRVGIVEKVSGPHIYIRRPEGLCVRDPHSALLFATPPLDEGGKE